MLPFLFYFFCFILDEAGFNDLFKRKQCTHGADTHNKKANFLLCHIYLLHHGYKCAHISQIIQILCCSGLGVERNPLGWSKRERRSVTLRQLSVETPAAPLTDRKANYLSHVLTTGSPDRWAGPGGRWEAGQHLNSRDRADAGERRYWTCIPKYWEWSTRG